MTKDSDKTSKRETQEGGTVEEPEEIYCQTCGVDLGEVREVRVDLNSGSIYCEGKEVFEKGYRCIDKALKGPTLASYVIPSLVQERIREGSIVNFGPLERSVS